MSPSCVSQNCVNFASKGEALRQLEVTKYDLLYLPYPRGYALAIDIVLKPFTMSVKLYPAMKLILPQMSIYATE